MSNKDASSRLHQADGFQTFIAFLPVVERRNILHSKVGSSEETHRQESTKRRPSLAAVDDVIGCLKLSGGEKLPCMEGGRNQAFQSRFLSASLGARSKVGTMGMDGSQPMDCQRSPGV